VGEASSSRSHPFFPIDVEMIANVGGDLDRKLRTLLRVRPYVGLGVALSAGFILGGGWRTRAGRLLIQAATRYAVVSVTTRLLVAQGALPVS
jgi:hypothetical protein